MLDRIDIRNILFSFIIGALIGLFSHIALNPASNLKSLMICVLMSGIIGLFVGTVIEFVMALLPVTIAKPGTYFLINNLTALFVTSVVILSLYFYWRDNFTTGDLVIVLIIAFGTVIGANILDYYKYKRTNARLMEYIEKRNKPN